MNSVFIEARNLNEAFFKCCRECLLQGYEYIIEKGSFETLKRKEFDFVTVQITNPGERPLAPLLPPSIVSPATDNYIEEYLSYLMTPEKQKNELYTYGEDLAGQIEEVIRRYKKEGFENNQLCMSVGSKDSLSLEHSQCLRIVDTRIRYGKLHFVVYFRSWDLWSGFPVNLGGLQLLKEYMADSIGVEDGEIIAVSKGLHLYDFTWPLASALTQVEL